MIEFTFDHGAVRAIVDGEKEKLNKAVWPAASAGAKVFYDQVKLNVRTNVMSSTAGHWFQGSEAKKAVGRAAKRAASYWIEPATLYKSIYYVYSADRSVGGKKVYHIGWNMQEAPYGHMVEFGTRRAPAHPFLNPAWSRRNDALDAAEAKLFEVMNDDS